MVRLGNQKKKKTQLLQCGAGGAFDGASRSRSGRQGLQGNTPDIDIPVDQEQKRLVPHNLGIPGRCESLLVRPSG